MPSSSPSSDHPEAGEIRPPPPVLSSYAMLANQPPLMRRRVLDQQAAQPAATTSAISASARPQQSNSSNAWSSLRTSSNGDAEGASFSSYDSLRGGRGGRGGGGRFVANRGGGGGRNAFEPRGGSGGRWTDDSRGGGGGGRGGRQYLNNTADWDNNDNNKAPSNSSSTGMNVGNDEPSSGRGGRFAGRGRGRNSNSNNHLRGGGGGGRLPYSSSNRSFDNNDHFEDSKQRTRSMERDEKDDVSRTRVDKAHSFGSEGEITDNTVGGGGAAAADDRRFETQRRPSMEAGFSRSNNNHGSAFYKNQQQESSFPQQQLRERESDSHYPHRSRLAPDYPSQQQRTNTNTTGSSKEPSWQDTRNITTQTQPAKPYSSFSDLSFAKPEYVQSQRQPPQRQSSLSSLHGMDIDSQQAPETGSSMVRRTSWTEQHAPSDGIQQQEPFRFHSAQQQQDDLGGRGGRGSSAGRGVGVGEFGRGRGGRMTLMRGGGGRGRGDGYGGGRGGYSYEGRGPPPQQQQYQLDNNNGPTPMDMERERDLNDVSEQWSGPNRYDAPQDDSAMNRDINSWNDFGRGRGGGRFDPGRGRFGGRGRGDLRRQNFENRADNNTGGPSGIYGGRGRGSYQSLSDYAPEQFQSNQAMGGPSPRVPSGSYGALHMAEPAFKDDQRAKTVPQTHSSMETIDVDAAADTIIEIDAPIERPPTPPPDPAEPSGSVMALTRLLDLETQMEFAYAKHMFLVQQQKLLRQQYQVLENLPVGIDAIKDEVAQFKEKHEEAKCLYED